MPVCIGGTIWTAYRPGILHNSGLEGLGTAASQMHDLSCSQPLRAPFPTVIFTGTSIYFAKSGYDLSTSNRSVGCVGVRLEGQA
jgi:hypothetical protein